MLCRKCGYVMSEGGNYCPMCGAELNSEHASDSVKMKYSSKNSGSGQIKYCRNCGLELTADSKYCPECGNEQEDVWAKIRKQNRMAAYVVAGALVLCFLIKLFSSYIKPTIDLNKYVTVRFDGYDTVGHAIADFDTERFTRDYGKSLSAKTYNRPKDIISILLNRSAGYTDPESAARNFLSNCVSGYLDSSENLTNGDVVTYIWDCNYDYAFDSFGYKIKYENIEKEVTDLEEAEQFDLFEGIDIFAEGISPYGTASIIGQPLAAAAENFRYDLDKSYDLSNGDTVTVTASVNYGDDPIEYCINNYGMIPSSLSKTFTIDGLSSYVESFSDITEDALEVLKSHAEEIFMADVSNNWGDDEILMSFTYIGNYILTPKAESDSWGMENALYLVYKAQVHNTYSDENDVYDAINDIYWYACYGDLIVNTDGEIQVDENNCWTPSDRYTIDSGISSGWWSTRSWYYYGYSSLSELYDNAISDSLDFYDCEDNIEEGENTASVENSEGKGDIHENGIIFPNSSEQLLNQEQLAELSEEDLRYAINELYARHGYIFSDESLLNYYEKYDWYNQEITPDNFNMDLFNEIEKENVQMLQAERNSRTN